MVELRKRKAPTQPSISERKGKRVHPSVGSSQSPTPKVGNVLKTGPFDNFPKVGDVIHSDGFGGEFETNDGNKTTLKNLINASDNGIVIFTYPRASTPGCTKQAGLFRDHYDSFTKLGLSVYGLSADSPKTNTTFKSKQMLPFPLLCNPSYTLIEAFGLKKLPKGTIRGVFALDKTARVLLLQAGGPDATVKAALAMD
ncbi:putative disrupter of telomere silencing protein Dot5 [Aspergillus heteromorphus CBS 117.55]|uniref:thioredoxin-dependent peroxiredoxin n=1 Tax=Aspergillus heteromorphus CBS 117.55 TaxID=1448321 RepID=A0A317UPH3_9EURO|nr:putative disrupter of telomere silencing protein Dot5 [Aspergillus heteromorphus CBS 117.55]PWY63893.1 putative disrupter of telomere silencing protein Dot5 [Aspergillus heteromorphus CBS 117.55]